MTNWNSASTSRISATQIDDGCARLKGDMEWRERTVTWLATTSLAAVALAGCSVTLPDDSVTNSTNRATASYQAQSESAKLVTVHVQGETLPLGVAQFLGIPFAEPPVGDRRFQNAAPKLFATTQTLEATRFPAVCPQNQGNASWYRDVAENFGTSRALIADQTNISEDCLYLNVWTPQDNKMPAPVMVWLHGGSNVNGWSYEPNYHGKNLAAHGVVVVSVQYRLGSLGFLPLVFESAGGNFALSDQVEALRWIKNNISQFGGDPNNVTVFGESAGGGNIAALMSGSAARGLFHKAIIQSGGSGTQGAVSPQAAGVHATAMFDSLSIGSARQARARPWQDYVQFAANDDSDYYHYPIDDGYYVNRTTKKTNRNATVALLIGTNRHEMLMYLDGTSADPFGDAVAETGASEALVATVQEYAEAQNWTALEAADFLTGLYYFHCPALQLAWQHVQNGQDVYLYTFTREREQDKGIKAYHGAEIPYVFDTHDDWLPTKGTDRTLTHAMTTYWTSFAKWGNPQSSELPPWPAYTFERPYTQELGDRLGEYTNLFLNACQLLTHEQSH